MSTANPADESKQVIPIENDGDIVTARNAGMRLSAHIGFSRTEQVKIATAISELARNIVLYAERGIVELEALDDPEQDNFSIAVIRVRQHETVATVLPKRRWGVRGGRSKRVRTPVAAATGLIGRTLHALRQRQVPERGGVS